MVKVKVKAKGKGKGKSKQKSEGWKIANTEPNPIPPKNWGKHPKDWRCTCKAYNYKSRETCIHCNKPRPADIS